MNNEDKRNGSEKRRIQTFKHIIKFVDKFIRYIKKISLFGEDDLKIYSLEEFVCNE